MINFDVDDNYKEFEEFTQNIKLHFDKSSNIITKKRNIIKLVDKGDRLVVVKSFKIPNFINKFAYRFIRFSKAKRSFLNAKELVKRGVNTPYPISYIEFFTPLLNESFYICEKFNYDFEIRELFLDPNFKDRDKILYEFIKFSYELHQKGIYHIDYSPGNVLVKKSSEGYQFSIVDLNRMKFIDFNNDLRFKNLSRFSARDEDTQKIAEIYSKISGIDNDFALKRLFFYHNRHQEYLRNKKRLKSLNS